MKKRHSIADSRRIKEATVTKNEEDIQKLPSLFGQVVKRSVRDAYTHIGQGCGQGNSTSVHRLTCSSKLRRQGFFLFF